MIAIGKKKKEDFLECFFPDEDGRRGDGGVDLAAGPAGHGGGLLAGREREGGHKGGGDDEVAGDGDGLLGEQEAVQGGGDRLDGSKVDSD